LDEVCETAAKAQHRTRQVIDNDALSLGEEVLADDITIEPSPVLAAACDILPSLWRVDRSRSFRFTPGWLRNWPRRAFQTDVAEHVCVDV
jgi:hypothetical protein